LRNNGNWLQAKSKEARKDDCREAPVPILSRPDTQSRSVPDRANPLPEKAKQIPMPETIKPLTDGAESEKDRLRRKLLRLIVQRETRRSHASLPPPHHPQLKR
jgi:hypothetical protein